MDRGVYHYSFCGLGLSLGAQFGGDISSGFTGISKFITNIGVNQQADISRFSGPAISKSVGISAKLKLKIGASAGASIGISRGVMDSLDLSESFFISGSTCPAAFEQIVDSRSPTAYSLSTGVNAGFGAGAVLGAIEKEQVASMSYSINQLHTVYGRDKWGRKLASLKMAAELMSVSPASGLSSVTGYYDLVGSAMAIAYGLLAPADCEDPAYLPVFSSTDISDIQTNSFVALAEILDDGNDAISEKGFCWSEEEQPDIDSNCILNTTGSNSFSNTISELKASTEYFVRAYATNEAGTAYGNQRNIHTLKSIDDVPPQVNDFLTPEDIEILKNEGLEIYTGLTPPNIEGNFYMNSLEELNGSMSFINYSYRFADQTSALKIKVYYESDNGKDVGEGLGAFIAGSGQTFSVYLETKGEIDEGTHTVILNTASIYSGIKTSSGIENFQFGFIVTHKENDQNNRFLNVGDTRIIYEADGLAERVTDFPFSPIKIISGNQDLMYKIYLDY